MLLTVLLLSDAVNAANQTIIVDTNRQVILDDPSGWVSSVGDQWKGESTTIRWYVLVINSSGLAAPSGISVTTYLRYPNGTVFYSASQLTDSNGFVNFSRDLNNLNQITTPGNIEGNWSINATAIVDSQSTSGNDTFIYDEYGCGKSGSACHSSNWPSSGTVGPKNPANTWGWSASNAVNSPYVKDYDWDIMHVNTDTTTGKNGHGLINPSPQILSGECVTCHKSYDGIYRGSSVRQNYAPQYAGGIHANKTGAACTDCHGNYTTANVAANMPIDRCYDCHPIKNNNLTSQTYTQSNNQSYSYFPLNTTNNIRTHDLSDTVPCIICHDNGHNISKPYNATGTSNTYTEYQQCTSCHAIYKRHNDSVSCTVCHSQDAHVIKVFAQNATYINSSTSSSRGNCTNCHQNDSFFNALEVQPMAGNYIGRNPPQVTTPLEHSNDPNAGRKWNQTPGYWNNSNQLTWCQYCHGNTTHKTVALGRPSLFDGNNTVNSTISTTTSWCSACHWQGYTNGLNNYNDMVSAFLPQLVPPEITGNATYGANQSISGYFNHSGVNKDDSSCKGCHGSLTQSTQITGLMHNVATGSGGGPDCISCHDYGKTGAQHRINNTAMRTGIHANLNKNATNSSWAPAENKKCWGCHDSDGSQPANDSMGDIYNNPYKCYDCHNATSKPYTNVSSALNVSEHFKGGVDIRAASNAADNSSSCLVCHNLTEMKVIYTEDDIYNSNYSLASHYGRNRTLDQVRQGVSTNCSYCHQNTSTVFVTAMIDPAYNSSIQNHSSNYVSPICTNCHSNGWIHNSTLVKPVSNDTFCSTCHGIGGSAATNNKVEHKRLYCTECHANSSNGSLAGKNIHGIKYLTQSNTFSTSNSSAVNCVTCHQTTIVDSSLNGFSAFKIQNPLHHSDNASNGTLWGNHWTSPQGACIYCHSDTKHNATPLGRILQWAPNYKMYGSISTNTSCANCHYDGDSNWSQMNSTYTSSGLVIPPEITNGTSWNGNTNYYNHTLSTYLDQDCKLCHGSLLSGSANMSEFQHNVATGAAGDDCIGCHTSQQGIYPAISLTSFTKHKNVNITDGLGNLTNSDCKTCHYNTTGMGTGYRSLPGVNLYTCENCHIQGNYSAPVIWNHRPPKLTASPGANITTGAYCTICHNNSFSLYVYSDNASVSHYETNTSLIKPTANQTSMPRFGFMTQSDAQAFNKECNNCHNPSNATWGNPTLIATPHTSLGTCKECHVNGNASDLHNGSLSLPQTFDCIACHTAYAARYNAPNITNTFMQGYPTPCGSCHGGDSANGIQDLNTHNTDRNFAGTPGSTDTVYLNNQISLTVPRGASVTVTSKVNDTTTGGASRVGGAEYYIDLDPGVGKGVPMNPLDGMFDAVNGAWENVTGTIDTSTLSDGNHTIYVRGMDIGKQWSGLQSASLTVQSIGYINGTVTSSGSPVAGAIVSTTGASYTTASDGNYSLTVPAGTYNVTASKQPRYNDSTANGVMVTPNNTTIQNLVLTLKPTGTIKGTVSTL